MEEVSDSFLWGIGLGMRPTLKSKRRILVRAGHAAVNRNRWAENPTLPVKMMRSV